MGGNIGTGGRSQAFNQFQRFGRMPAGRQGFNVAPGMAGGATTGSGMFSGQYSLPSQQTDVLPLQRAVTGPRVQAPSMPTPMPPQARPPANEIGGIGMNPVRNNDAARDWAFRKYPSYFPVSAGDTIHPKTVEMYWNTNVPDNIKQEAFAATDGTAGMGDIRGLGQNPFANPVQAPAPNVLASTMPRTLASDSMGARLAQIAQQRSAIAAENRARMQAEAEARARAGAPQVIYMQDPIGGFTPFAVPNNDNGGGDGGDGSAASGESDGAVGGEDGAGAGGTW